MSHFWQVVAILALLIPGCAAFQPNTEWARRTNAAYILVRVPASQWQDTLKLYKAPSNFICFFLAPGVIYQQEGIDCLEHELGHLREYQEGLEPHSRYARD